MANGLICCIVLFSLNFINCEYANILRSKSQIEWPTDFSSDENLNQNMIEEEPSGINMMGEIFHFLKYFALLSNFDNLPNDMEDSTDKTESITNVIKDLTSPFLNIENESPVSIHNISNLINSTNIAKAMTSKNDDFVNIKKILDDSINMYDGLISITHDFTSHFNEYPDGNKVVISTGDMQNDMVDNIFNFVLVILDEKKRNLIDDESAVKENIKTRLEDKKTINKLESLESVNLEQISETNSEPKTKRASPKELVSLMQQMPISLEPSPEKHGIFTWYNLVKVISHYNCVPFKKGAVYDFIISYFKDIVMDVSDDFFNDYVDIAYCLYTLFKTYVPDVLNL